MAKPRNQQVDLDVCTVYHLLSRTVRQQRLCGGRNEDRKDWLEARIELLAGIFTIDISNYSIMDNHLHLLVNVDRDQALGLSDQEVLRRWMVIHPPAKVDMDDDQAVQEWIDKQIAEDRERVDKLRHRLYNMGWLMKELKEPLARWANVQDGCSGHFWDGRYKSIAVVDTFAFLATAVYIDLNPIAAGIATLPENSRHTSMKCRIDFLRRQGMLDQLRGSMYGNDADRRAVSKWEETHWLMPIEDRRDRLDRDDYSSRAGAFESMSLGRYLMLVEAIGKMKREGKAQIDPEIIPIFERLGIDPEPFCAKVCRMAGRYDLRGNAFAGERSHLKPLVESRNQHHTVNLDVKTQ